MKPPTHYSHRLPARTKAKKESLMSPRTNHHIREFGLSILIFAGILTAALLCMSLGVSE